MQLQQLGPQESQHLDFDVNSEGTVGAVALDVNGHLGMWSVWDKAKSETLFIPFPSCDLEISRHVLFMYSFLPNAATGVFRIGAPPPAN